MEVDFERYARFLEETDLTDAQKRQMLQALWGIVSGFVDLGFGVNATQSTCGKLEKGHLKKPFRGDPKVQSPLRKTILEFAGAQRSDKDNKNEGAIA